MPQNSRWVVCCLLLICQSTVIQQCSRDPIRLQGGGSSSEGLAERFTASSFDVQQPPRHRTCQARAGACDTCQTDQTHADCPFACRQRTTRVAHRSPMPAARRSPRPARTPLCRASRLSQAPSPIGRIKNKGVYLQIRAQPPSCPLARHTFSTQAARTAHDRPGPQAQAPSSSQFARGDLPRRRSPSAASGHSWP